MAMCLLCSKEKVLSETFIWRLNFAPYYCLHIYLRVVDKQENLSLFFPCRL